MVIHKEVLLGHCHYLNKLPLQVTDRLLVQYADDTTLIYCGSTPAAAAINNSQLQLVSNFISDSRMMLNFNKSNVMWFRGNRKKLADYPPIVVDGVTLKVVDKQKYLRVILDLTLCWANQVANVCKKMAYYFHLINSHKQTLSTQLIKLLVGFLVFSHLYYALPVWGPYLTQQLSQHLLRLKNRAVRLINPRYHDHLSQYYQHLQWLPFQYLTPFCSV